MKPEELQHIIDQFDEDELKSQGIFGIYQYGGAADESYIRANKAGLEIVALELLKASKEAENILVNGGENSIITNHREDWFDENSTTQLDYIELIAHKQKNKPKEVPKESLANSFFIFCFFLIFILLLASIFIGLATIIMWFF